MFGAGTLTFLVLFLVVSILAHEAPLFLLSLALLVAAGLSRVWERHCLDGLEYRRHFTTHRASFGETIELSVEIVNRKILPLAWLEIEDEIPRELPPSRGKILYSHKPTRSLVAMLIALRPYERIYRRYPIPCTVRGEHIFGPVRLRTGDLFGLVSREMTYEETDVLVVYPRVVPLTALGLPAHQPLGEIRTRSWLFEDPSQLAGIRAYRPGDSLRRVHWAATARTQQLQVKVFEPTTSHKLAIFLNVKSTPGGWWGLDYDPDALEMAITTAASVSAWAIEQGYQVGLWTNGMHRFGHLRVSVDSSSSSSQLSRILEALGRLQPIAVRPFDETLAQDTSRLAYGSTIVVISAVLTEPVVAELLGLRRRGHSVTLLYVGRQTMPGALDGIVMRQVGPPGAWRDLPEMSFTGR
jgi:uncharacterized protein (DUF58 family)